MKAKKLKRKPRRVVLGVGYPWFHIGQQDGMALTETAVNDSILLRVFSWKPIDPKNLGNWNKVRLVAEVLK